MNSFRFHSGTNHNNLSFLEHLEILRHYLLIAVAFFGAAVVLCFLFADPLIAILRAPLKDLDVSLYFLKPQEKFFSYILLSTVGAFFIIFPVLIGMVIHFIFPALEKRERKGLFLFAVLIPLFLYGGAIFGYGFIIPFAMDFFLHFAGNDGIQPLWSIRSYLGITMSIVIASGIAFQTPWILLFFMKTGILPTETLRKGRKYVVIIGFLCAAIISPPDIYTQLIIGTILYVLFELSLLLAKVLRITDNYYLDESKDKEEKE